MDSPYCRLSNAYCTRYQHAFSCDPRRSLPPLQISDECFVGRSTWSCNSWRAVRSCFDWSRGKSLQYPFWNGPEGAQLPVRRILTVATPIFAGLLVVFLSTAIDIAMFEKPLLDLLSNPAVQAAGSIPERPAVNGLIVGHCSSRLQLWRGKFREHQSVFALRPISDASDSRVSWSIEQESQARFLDWV